VHYRHLLVVVLVGLSGCVEKPKVDVPIKQMVGVQSNKGIEGQTTTHSPHSGNVNEPPSKIIYALTALIFVYFFVRRRMPRLSDAIEGKKRHVRIDRRDCPPPHPP
jgi:hypothetical protein